VLFYVDFESVYRNVTEVNTKGSIFLERASLMRSEAAFAETRRFGNPDGSSNAAILEPTRRPWYTMQSKDSHERGLRVTMLTGFGIVIALTLLIAGWSYYHITTLGSAAENLFTANYRSIQYVRVMDGVMHDVVLDARSNALNEQTWKQKDAQFLRALTLERNNITESGERETVVHLASNYAELQSAVVAYLVAASQPAAEVIHSKATIVFESTAKLISINENAMFVRADAAKEKAAFARYSTLLITLVLVVMAILLALAVSRRSLAEFRELDRAKSNFVATAAHELKNPLSSIKTTTGMLLGGLAGPLKTRQADLLTNVRTESDRLLTLVHELLDLARLETGTLELRTQQIDTHTLIESAALPVMLQAERAGATLDFRVAPGTPDVLVDANKISWAITNLLLNAIRFSPRDSSIIVSASEIENEVWISVADTGKGIAEKDLSRIFEKFVQVEDAAMGGGVGSGLGLSIAREIVLAHRGRIWASSTPGEGTTFTIALPRLKSGGRIA
jgi:signal transduction histidine kinase